MKIICCFITFLIFISEAYLFAQNLVLNPSMEDTVQCPPINFIQLSCPPWYRAYATPDYYRGGCLNLGCCTPMPWLNTGYQLPKTGNAYLGFGVYDKSDPQSREFIGGKLSDSLDAGHKYCVEIWVSPANNFRYQADGFGIFFSHDSVIAPIIIKPHIMMIPQVENAQGNVISDTSVWTQIYGEFYAQGGEQFICIGNFRDDSLTTLDSITANTSNQIGYYYLDDVSVTDCTVGIEEIQKFDFSIFPNPTNNHILMNVKMNNLSAISIDIYDSMGRSQLKEYYPKGKRPYRIDVSDLQTGIYFIKLSTDRGNVVKKIIKY